MKRVALLSSRLANNVTSRDTIYINAYSLVQIEQLPHLNSNVEHGNAQSKQDFQRRLCLLYNAKDDSLPINCRFAMRLKNWATHKEPYCSVHTAEGCQSNRLFYFPQCLLALEMASHRFAPSTYSLIATWPLSCFASHYCAMTPYCYACFPPRLLCSASSKFYRPPCAFPGLS